ncbi:MAG: hypothetical protein LH702_04670 [Phormidesmis sp. CAN_BIN44]|nr:hypothetical protein [Phormidesmis sp. CAN_BIN44]
MNPKNYSLKVLIGKTCPVDRDACLFTPSRWYQSQRPERFEYILKHWEERGEELLKL